MGEYGDGISVFALNSNLSGVHIIAFLIPNWIGVKSTFRDMKIHFLCHWELWQVFWVSLSLCTTLVTLTVFGMFKYVNISNKKINILLQTAVYILQHVIFFYNLTSYFQLFTVTTWLISAFNINQSTIGIVLDGIIRTPEIFSFLHLTTWCCILWCFKLRWFNFLLFMNY